ncbi:MAG TPA: transposase [Thermoanaerobaculia bacterium]|jgi:REP element-mobilizing transposase RayT
MPRVPRIDFPGAIHHVIVKGNEGKEIYRDDEDRKTYLHLLRRYHERYRFGLLAYCLMGTHAHLAIETGETPLSRVMQAFQTAYAQAFNTRHGREGHVFVGRYKAFLVQADQYLLALVRYIHDNPVAAGMCPLPENYPWSSDRFYRDGGAPSWLDCEMVLSMLASGVLDAARAYRDLMSRSEFASYDLVPVTACVKGDEQFARKLFRKEKRTELLRDALTPARIAEAVAVATGIHVADLRGPGRTRPLCAARGLIAHVGKRYGSVPFAGSARYLDRDESTIVKLAGRIERALPRSAELRESLGIALLRLGRVDPA